MNPKFLGIAAIVVMAFGCRNVDDDFQVPAKTKKPNVPQFNAAAPAGATVAQLNPNVIRQDVLAAAAKPPFRPRRDPFELQPIEKHYETKQDNMRVFRDTGQFWPTLVEGSPEVIEVPTYQEQPYRRLAGILVGETVLAIIDMGDGRPMRIIRPGEQIEGTEWTVLSIDEEKAVLRRSGDFLPREITVRLESPPIFRPAPGTGGPAQGGAGGQTGGNDGGGDPSTAGIAP